MVSVSASVGGVGGFLPPAVRGDGSRLPISSVTKGDILKWLWIRFQSCKEREKHRREHDLDTKQPPKTVIAI